MMMMMMRSADTNTLQYWLNWRYLLCTVWVLAPMSVAAYLIWKYEGPSCQSGEEHTDTAGMVYSDESWRPCMKQIHPAWLLLLRVLSFCVLLTLLLVNFVVDGADMFYYYTQWTLMLVTIYFALGSLLSIHGCQRYLRASQSGVRAGLIVSSDRENGTYVAPTIWGNSNSNSKPHVACKGTNFHEADVPREIAGFWGYLFQIIYQTNAGAVMLTDCVFWLIIFPFRAMKDYDLSFLLVGMHSVNMVFLLGDTVLNSLRFPWFRISYFLLFTGIYVIFQWTVHASISLWWPYPFLDLSSSLAPAWYLLVASLHIPCYALFLLVLKLKHSFLARWFSHYDYFVK